MKQGKIYLYDQYVGLLTEDETGFTLRLRRRLSGIESSRSREPHTPVIR